MSVESLAATDRAMFLTNEGESVTYNVFATSQALARNAIVYRHPLERVEENSMQYGRTRFNVLVADDATLGIVSADVTVQKDTIDVKRNPADATTTKFTVVSKRVPIGGFHLLGVVAGS